MTMRRLVFVLAVAAAAVLLAVPVVAADGAVASRGDVHAFAAGAGLDIGGHAQMVRTAAGRTYVTVHATGLAPNTAYPSHVHALPCGLADADGHYRRDPAGPATPPNEIWQGFTTDADGVGNGRAVANFTAGMTAVSVVIHAPGGAKIACADLD
jgi:hypothetical protein